ncbi:hypothetical protein B0H34DRAFT_859014 [Crassisporium funariophilum]|nr:hypothetical protein B0H34DRAFT_859014 [Crassisporium funariophilum]
MLNRYLLANSSKLCLRPNYALRRLYSTPKIQHNQSIVDLLRKYKEDEENRNGGNVFKIHAFVRAIQSISRLDKAIQCGNEILELRGVGPGIIKRIDDYLQEASEEAGEINLDLRKSRALTFLKSVPGIGPAKAKKLVDAGCLGPDDLRSGRFSAFLNAKQNVQYKYMGLDYLAVQRQEAEDVLNFCRDSLGPSYEVVLVGEFRRGASSSEKIELMVSHPDFVHLPLPNGTSRYLSAIPKSKAGPKPYQRKNTKMDAKQENFLHERVIPLLHQRGLMVQDTRQSKSVWQGIARLPGSPAGWESSRERVEAIRLIQGQYRAMTVHMVPQKSRGASLIHLTGDDAFIEDINWRAEQLGLHFNNFGLWKVLSNSNEVTVAEALENPESLTHGYWSLVNSTTEAEIFEELGMDFVVPEKRNFEFLSDRPQRRRKTALV